MHGSNTFPMSEADAGLFLHNHLYQPEHELRESHLLAFHGAVKMPAMDQSYNWNKQHCLSYSCVTL